LDHLLVQSFHLYQHLCTLRAISYRLISLILVTKLALGILTFLKIKYPLSFVLYPNLGPISPASMPGKRSIVWISLSYTINGRPVNFFPSTTSFANTIAWVAVSPISPGQYLVAVIVGVFMINSYFSLSNVAVVSNPYKYIKIMI
jgi:hypothetical protein